MSSSVVGRSDRPEPLLTRSVPLDAAQGRPISQPRLLSPGPWALQARAHDLQLDSLALQFDRPDLEIHTDGRDVRFGVRVVCESEQETGFPYARVSDQEELRWSRARAGVRVRVRVAVGWREGGRSA